jgi:hypothetical protein
MRIVAGDARTTLVEMESKGYFVTHDQGATWKPVRGPQEPIVIQDLRISGTDLVLLGWTGLVTTPLAHFGRVHVSRDQGRTWASDWPDSVLGIAARKDGVLALRAEGDLRQRLPDGNWSTLAPFPEPLTTVPTTTPAGDLIAASAKGPWRFSDAGAGWVSIKGDLPDSIRWDEMASSGNVLFIGRSALATVDVWYQSADGGAHWTRSDTSFRDPYRIASSGSTHLSLNFPSEWRISRDDAKTWSSLATPPADSGFQAYSVHVREDVFYLGGSRARVWSSRDSCRTWSASRVNTRSLWVGHMASTDRDFYAYSENTGLYRFEGRPEGVDRRSDGRREALRSRFIRDGVLLFQGSGGSRRADGRLRDHRTPKVPPTATAKLANH